LLPAQALEKRTGGPEGGIGLQGVIEVDDGNFESEVLRSPLPVLLDFSAEWCGPCKRLQPLVEALAKDYDGRLKVAHLDVDKAQATAVRCGIMSVPTVLIFKEGKVQEQLLGYVPRDVLVGKINPIL
jgi:thioredoxin